jgi:hypothetical protein
VKVVVNHSYPMADLGWMANYIDSKTLTSGDRSAQNPASGVHM